MSNLHIVLEFTPEQWQAINAAADEAVVMMHIDRDEFILNLIDILKQDREHVRITVPDNLAALSERFNELMGSGATSFPAP